MRKISLLTAMLTFIIISSTWAADISGKWTLTMWGAGAEESVPVVFKADGEDLTVTCTHPAFKEMAGTGTLKGNEISFNLKSSAMEIAFTGKVDGNKMEGVREIKASGDGRGGGAPGGATPQGGMPEGTGGSPGGPGGAPSGTQIGQSPAPGGQGAPAGGQDALQGDTPGGGQTQSSENWTAVRK